MKEDFVAVLSRIDKLIPGPWLRMLAKEGHMIDLKAFFQRLFDFFISWGGGTASEFKLENICIFGEGVKVHDDDDDDIFEFLSMGQ